MVSVQTSVVVPVYNDPDGLRTTLDALVDQTADRYEVVVVDNASTDDTPAVAAEYGTRFEFVRFETERDVQSSYAARNEGIARSNGEVIGFLDADVRVERTYVESITRSIIDDDKMYVGCNIEVVLQNERSCVGRYNRATGFPVEAYMQVEQFAPTACLVVHRDLIERVGRFDATLVSGGDLEFGRRVAAHGIEQTFEEDITVYHPARRTLSSLLKKNARVGRGLEQLTIRHPDRFTRDTSFFHPKHYLPGHPVRFYRRYRNETQNPVEIGCWYALAWLEGVAKTGGRIDQSIR